MTTTATSIDNLRSFIPTTAESHFPIQNLPYGVFRPKSGGMPRCGVAIGDLVVDLAELERVGLLKVDANIVEPVFAVDSLNPFMALGRTVWRQVRGDLQKLLAADNPRLRDDDDLRRRALLPLSEVELLLPVRIGDYTDFYSSKDHAFNVGSMMRGPDNALQANWLHLPVGYHGRAGSIVVSGTDLHRPLGQTKKDDEPTPTFGPSRMIDFELEMGFVIGTPTRLGESVSIADAAEHIFGLVLVNDWSARDIQKWEYVPLGPFLAKNFGTTISPWVVTMDALEPFWTAGPPQDPPVLDYLKSPDPRALDVELEVWLKPELSTKSTKVTHSNARHLYWDIRQQLAHHTSNGCNIRTGDLMASGTISGPTPESRGCMLERTWRGSQPVELADGQSRKFLEDGDRITMTGWAQAPSYRIGFGEATGKLLAAS